MNTFVSRCVPLIRPKRANENVLDASITLCSAPLSSRGRLVRAAAGGLTGSLPPHPVRAATPYAASVAITDRRTLFIGTSKRSYFIPTLAEPRDMLDRHWWDESKVVSVHVFQWMHQCGVRYEPVHVLVRVGQRRPPRQGLRLY